MTGVRDFVRQSAVGNPTRRLEVGCCSCGDGRIPKTDA